MRLADGASPRMIDLSLNRGTLVGATDRNLVGCFSIIDQMYESINAERAGAYIFFILLGRFADCPRPLLQSVCWKKSGIIACLAHSGVHVSAEMMTSRHYKYLVPVGARNDE